MGSREGQIQLGIGAIVASLVFLFVVIPNFVSTPSNVSNIVLSPLFWPNAIAIFTGLTGLGMVATSLRLPKRDRAPSDVDNRPMAFLRLFGIALIMAVTFYAMPRLGLVWTSMLAFVATAFLVRTHHPVAAILSGIAIPLFLYLFFAHVAGVAIPQGNFVRLP